MASGTHNMEQRIDVFPDAVSTSLFQEERPKSPQVSPVVTAVEVEPGRRPRICITPRFLPGHDQFAASESVADVEMEAIIAAGGLPVMMPITKDLGLIHEYVESCDGFTITGGHSVNSRRWGEEPRDPEELAPARDALEFPLVEMVLAANKPLFAVCRGMQLLNVALGGTLSQYLYEMRPRPGMTHWRHSVILDRPAHPVEVTEGTLLSRIVGGRPLLQANSSHHECVCELGHDLVVSGYATDGIVEAIEYPAARFALGVQWHPEYTWRAISTDFALWRAFVEASAGEKDAAAGAAPASQGAGSAASEGRF